MPEPVMQWLALIGAIVVGMVFLREMLRWKSPSALLARPKQRKLRVAEVILLEALFTMMFLGPWAVGKHSNPLVVLLYWMICVFIGLAVVLIAMFDLLSITKGYRRYDRRMYNGLEGDDHKN